MAGAETDRITELINSSDLISRDLSWLKFNERVLDQAKKDRTLLEKLKFLAITDSNLDEFFMIRVGSLYNYLDYGKERTDYSQLREYQFKKRLFAETQMFVEDQQQLYGLLASQFEAEGFIIERNLTNLTVNERAEVEEYFDRTIFSMLTPMAHDNYHTFPLLMNKLLIFGVWTQVEDGSGQNRLSFVQIPSNLPKFYEIDRGDQLVFIPIEEVIRYHMEKLYRNVVIESMTLFRITRNGDFTLEESDDIEANFLEELRLKLKTRRTGRVVRVETEYNPDPNLLLILKERFGIDEDNIFRMHRGSLVDYTRFWRIVGHPALRSKLPKQPSTVRPISLPEKGEQNMLEVLKQRDILLHHPYNNMEPLLELLDQAARDPKVLSIKMTIYRLSKESRIVEALLKAAENGKHVSVLFEVKARFDEENNIEAAKQLQAAGCFVIYGISNLKTHTKLCLIVRKGEEGITSYVHMSSGNYNESTSKLYTDLGMLTTKREYAKDVAEFFNVITGHSNPHRFKSLITAPNNMRNQLIEMIEQEGKNAREGKPSGICFKMNSLQDKKIITALYEASQAGVPIKMIVRGICCLRPKRVGLSENIEVMSIVGDFLEHSRVYYFHNEGDPLLYSGSADVMVRSFDRRLESLYLITDDLLKRQVINLLHFNMKDNVNAYEMHEDGSFTRKKPAEGENAFSVHKEFFRVRPHHIEQVAIF
ncbi:polyphosphate kinase 1 [Persicobacter sp. CCB-QB2]|uniref:polyphosphate kinase 1 n=1 Tax=Persicobacter sp. CCB-QB2 TaxID=1561025 RepID=UPI0006A9FF3D|nr:polyphosphate kinase 1 [Persicobacter sp. CCB-QB2]